MLMCTYRTRAHTHTYNQAIRNAFENLIWWMDKIEFSPVKQTELNDLKQNRKKRNQKMKRHKEEQRKKRQKESEMSYHRCISHARPTNWITLTLCSTLLNITDAIHLMWLCAQALCARYIPYFCFFLPPRTMHRPWTIDIQFLIQRKCFQIKSVLKTSKQQQLQMNWILDDNSITIKWMNLLNGFIWSSDKIALAIYCYELLVSSRLAAIIYRIA